MRGLQGKTILVAGAVPGNIGGATAVRLAEEGAHVVVADLNEAAAVDLAEDLNGRGLSATATPLDIGDEASWQRAVRHATDWKGTVDGLFNVAADLSADVLGRDTSIVDIPLDVWGRTLHIDLTGYLLGIRTVLPIMQRNGGGAIVNTMSSAAWMA